MKNVLIVVALVVAAIVGWQFNAQPSDTSEAEVEAMLLATAPTPNQRRLYEILREKYPQEYQQFLSDMAEFATEAGGMDRASREQGFALGQHFTSTVRIENAHYMASAPYAAINRIRLANVAVLRDLMDTPELCAVFALQGGAGIRLDQIDQLNLDLLAEGSNATFLALAAGRDTPVDHAPASQGEIQMVVNMWRDQDSVSDALVMALTVPNVQNPLACEANLSFEDYLSSGSDPLVQKVSVTLSLIAAGQ